MPPKCDLLSTRMVTVYPRKLLGDTSSSGVNSVVSKPGADQALWCSHTQSYSENAREYSNFGRDVQYGGDQAAVQLAGVTLVLRLGPEAGDAATLIVRIERQVQADRVVDAADKTHAGIGLLFHDAVSESSKSTPL